MAEKGGRFAVRFDLKPPSLHTVSMAASLEGGPRTVEYRLPSLPLHLAGQFPRLLDELRPS